MTRPDYITPAALQSFIQSALAEDIGEGDHSTLGSIPHDKQASARLLIKEECKLAGIELALEIFQAVDPTLSVDLLRHDGDDVSPGDVAFVVSGRVQSILQAERLVLNCMQRMSGIATLTHRLARLIEGTRARLMDTRKTTPNFRLAEKWAVAIGGGVNHRFALYDMVMLKDNHVDMGGGITRAIASTREYLKRIGRPLRIEVETRNLAEVEEALQSRPDVIMLDNMSVADMRAAVARINGVCKTEASGGITEATIRAVAECGVDYISVGALTHSVKSVDLSLKVVKDSHI
ncbi:MAG: carboxylating nicotinate-nucleotide diphosphorylase [Cyclobacteriaceae bacterium]|jgi:nicotinate-nucleotide pyrophosphorylase (carboxylating)